MLDSLACLVTKRSIEIRGKGHLVTSPEERNGFNEDQKILSGKAKSKITLFRLNKLFSIPFLLPRPLQSFGKCDKFTSFGQCNTRCKRNMQIEILSESPRRRSKLCRPRHPRIITPLLFGTSKSPLLLVQAS